MRSKLAVLLIAGCTLSAAPAALAVDSKRVNDGNVVLEGVPEIPARIGEMLRRYENVRSASFGDWAEGGSAIYVSTRFGETSQTHRVDSPGGARHQITFFDEPVRGIDRRPGSESLLFSMDEGGSEFYQLYLLDPAGGSRRLTDGESRNAAAEWSHDGDWLAYQSTRRNGQANDIWIQPAGDPDAARLLVEAPGGAWWGPTDWSRDRSKLLVAQYLAVDDSRLHLVDVESGELRRIAGGDDAPASYLGVNPVLDRQAKGVYLATDAASEFTQLGYLELETGEIDYITDGIPWDVEDFDLSDDGMRAAFTVNEGGLTRLYLLDPASREYTPVDLPTGLARSLSFSPDGKRLAMTLNTAQIPGDVFTLELGEDPRAATGLTRWTHSEVGGLDAERFSVPDLIAYPTFDGREIPAFVYRPEGEGPHPVVISIHGGPEGQFRPAFRSTFQTWVDALGAAIIAPNVRGSSGYGKAYLKLDNGFSREDSVKDIGALLDWIADQPELDENRVAVYGGSYGGYMVLASLVHYSDRLAAGVDIVGISNFVTFLENTQDYRRDLRRVEYGDERDEKMRAHLERISPNRHADAITVPLFVAQGENDPRVPVTESAQIVHDVRAAGYEVWYMNALNEGHGFRKKENRDLFNQLVVWFLEQQLLESAEQSSPIRGSGD